MSTNLDDSYKKLCYTFLSHDDDAKALAEKRKKQLNDLKVYCDFLESKSALYRDFSEISNELIKSVEYLDLDMERLKKDTDNLNKLVLALKDQKSKFASMNTLLSEIDGLDI